MSVFVTREAGTLKAIFDLSLIHISNYGGIPPTPYIFLSVYIEFVFSKMQTTPRIGFWLDNSNQTPQQTAETILNAKKPV